VSSGGEGQKRTEDDGRCDWRGETGKRGKEKREKEKDLPVGRGRCCHPAPDFVIWVQGEKCESPSVVSANWKRPITEKGRAQSPSRGPPCPIGVEFPRKAPVSCVVPSFSLRSFPPLHELWSWFLPSVPSVVYPNTGKEFLFFISPPPFFLFFFFSFFFFFSPLSSDIHLLTSSTINPPSLHPSLIHPPRQSASCSLLPAPTASFEPGFPRQAFPSPTGNLRPYMRHDMTYVRYPALQLLSRHYDVAPSASSARSCLAPSPSRVIGDDPDGRAWVRRSRRLRDHVMRNVPTTFDIHLLLCVDIKYSSKGPLLFLLFFFYT